MDTKLIDTVSAKYKKVKHPDFSVGDIVEVHTRIKEGDKERIQIFKGIVLRTKGAGISKSFTVRKISYGIGVEKTFPLYSPNVAKIKIVTKGKTRRSKLYYLRDRVGKAALKAGVQTPVEGEDYETKILEEETKATEDEGAEETPVETSDKKTEEAKPANEKEEKGEEKEEKKEAKPETSDDISKEKQPEKKEESDK